MPDLVTPEQQTSTKTEGSKRVWIQLAEVGSWKGHPSGPFSLTPKVFDQIVHNFKRDGLPIPFDMEHASEASATDGTIPSEGAPAQGWVHELDNRGNAGLWGLTEWLEPARSYIKSGKYRYCSPAVRFGSKDRTTGEPIGARLSSVALTNQPWLRNLHPLTAKDNSGNLSALTAKDAMSSLAHGQDEYMGRIRGALKLHPLATAAECSEHLEKLCDHVMSAGDAGGMHEGVSLSEFTAPLRELVGASPGHTWEHVFDTVQDLIDAAVGEHEVEYHEADSANMSATGGEEPIMTIEKDEKTVLALRDAQTEVSTLQLTLKDAQATSSKLAEDNKVLLAWKAEREEADVKLAVDNAFETYKDLKGLKDDDKAAMLIVCKSAPEAFAKLYPKLERHVPPYIGRTLVKDEPKLALKDGGLPPTGLTFGQLVSKIEQDRKVTYQEAQIIASSMIGGV